MANASEKLVRYTPPTPPAPKRAMITYYADPKKQQQAAKPAAQKVEPKPVAPVAPQPEKPKPIAYMNDPKKMVPGSPAASAANTPALTTSGVGVMQSKPDWMPQWMWDFSSKQNAQINTNRSVNQAGVATQAGMKPQVNPHAETAANWQRILQQENAIKAAGGTPPATNMPGRPQVQKQPTIGSYIAGAAKKIGNALSQVPMAKNTVPQQYMDMAAGRYAAADNVRGVAGSIVRPALGTPALGMNVYEQQKHDAQVNQFKNTINSPARPTQQIDGGMKTNPNAAPTSRVSFGDNPNWRNENADILMTTDEYIRRNNARLDVSNPRSGSYNPQSPFYQKSMEDYFNASFAAGERGEDLSLNGWGGQNRRPAAFWEPLQTEYTARQSSLLQTSNPNSHLYNPNSPQYQPALEQWFRDFRDAQQSGEEMNKWMERNPMPNKLSWVPFGSGYVALQDAPAGTPPPQDTGGGYPQPDYGGGGQPWTPEDYANWQMRMLEWTIPTNRGG